MKEMLLKSNEELRTYRENAWREFNATMNGYYKKDMCREDAIQTAKNDGFRVISVFDSSEKRQNEVRDISDCHISDFKHLEEFWEYVSVE